LLKTLKAGRKKGRAGIETTTTPRPEPPDGSSPALRNSANRNRLIAGVMGIRMGLPLLASGAAEHADEGLVASNDGHDRVAQVAADDERLGPAPPLHLPRREGERRERLEGLAARRLFGDSLRRS
jgi:hypothetical protein